MIELIIAVFFAAALVEIGGGYLIWKWIKEKINWIFGLIGGLILFGYGILLTLQPAHFGRVYAAYGGIFITTSILWGVIVDKKTPDKCEIIGAGVTLVGAMIIFFVPR